MNAFARWIASFLILMSMGVSVAAHADVSTGIQWLSAQSQPNGSIATLNDVAIPFQSTGETLRALALVSQPLPQAATQFLGNEGNFNTENLSRLIINDVNRGLNPAPRIQSLLFNQDSASGGYGESIGYQATVIDTVFALEALALSNNINHAAATHAIDYLKLHQNTDGSWADNNNAPSVYLTALALSSLQYYRDVSNVDSVLQAGAAYLLSQRDASGLWGGDMQSAIALLSLKQTLTERGALAASIHSFSEHQRSDGSWQGDVFITALAIRALATSGVMASNAPEQALEWGGYQSPSGGTGANENQLISISVANNSDSDISGVVVAYVMDSMGRRVAVLSPYAGSIDAIQLNYIFIAHQSQLLKFSWNPNQNAAGEYRVIINIVTPGSITRENPYGNVLLEYEGATSVNPTSAIAGSLAFNPPLIQAGSSAPVTLDVLVTNSGNVSLSASPLHLVLTSSQTGAILFEATASTSVLTAGQFEYVHFGQWTPSESGNITATVSPLSSVAGMITGKLYVGDKPQGTFAVTPNVVPVGNSTVQAEIAVVGIDAAVGVEPAMAAQVRTAVARGAKYVSDQAQLKYQSRDRCLQCHVQAQAVYGLSSLADHDVYADDQTIARTVTTFNNQVRLAQLGSGKIDVSDGYSLGSYLAAWSTAKLSDKRYMFSTQYNIARFLSTLAQTSGSMTHWNVNAPDAWWDTVDAFNMMATKGLVDVVQSSTIPNISTVTPPGTLDLKFSGAPGSILKKGPDGYLYLLQPSAATITKIAPNSGQSIVVASGLPASTRAFDVAGPSDFYIITTSDDGGYYSDIQRWSNGSLTYLNHVFPNTAKDVTVGPDGNVYIDWWAGGFVQLVSRILPDHSIENIQGGAPVGESRQIIVGPDGMLYIADSMNNTVHRMPAQSSVSPADVKSIIPQLSGKHSPVAVAVGPGGVIYITEKADINQAPTAVFRFQPDGSYQIMATSTSGFRSVVLMDDGTLFVADNNGAVSRVIPANSVQMDLSLVPFFKQLVENAARYTLSVYGDSAGPLVQALRMIQLADAAKITADSALRAQISGAMANLDSSLRAAQHADGGWSSAATLPASDSLVTAWAGLALNTLNPSPADPVVQKTIQFLLTNQNPSDYSWSSTEGILGQSANNSNSTSDGPLGPTSLVMSYLPEAMDLIAGLNLSLHLEVPPTIALSNGTLTPQSESTTASGDIAYTYKMPGVTSAVRTLAMDLSLAGMHGGESRPAASQAYITSVNSFDGSVVRVDLTIPTITATSGIALSAVQSDQLTYKPTDTASFSATVASINSAPFSGAVRFSIYASADDALVTQLAPAVFNNISSGETVSVLWPVGQVLAGNYYVVAELLDVSGSSAGTRRGDFSVGTGSASVASLRVTTDRQSYHSTDQVNIAELVQNVTSNQSIAGAMLIVMVNNPSGTETLNQQFALGEIPAGGVVQRSLVMPLQAAPQGTYAVTGLLRDANGILLSEQHASFIVTEIVSRALTGAVNVASASVSQGQLNQCMHTLTNQGTVAVSDLPVQWLLVRLDVDQLLSTTSATATLAPSAHQSYVQNIVSPMVATGVYACVLQIQAEEGWTTVAHANFKVTPEVLRVANSVMTDSATYGRNGLVGISSSVHSLMQYRSLTGAMVRTVVTSPSGTVLQTKDVALPTLAPDATAPVSVSYPLSQAAEGTYGVSSYVVSSTGDVVASDQASFQVRVTAAEAITGVVTVQQAAVQQGDSLTCTDQISNDSLFAVNGLNVRQILERTDVSQTVSSTPSTINVAGGGNQTLIRNFSTTGYSVGDYACRLEAQINSQWVTLGSASFHVQLPPVRVNGSFGLGSKGRLLVLSDRNNTSSGGSTCTNKAVNATFELDFDHSLSPNAVAAVKVYNILGLLVDAETVGLRSFSGEVSTNPTTGTNLSIPSFTVDDLVITLAGPQGGELVDTSYRIVATITDPLGNMVYSSGLVSFTCNLAAAVGDIVGQGFKIIGFNMDTHTGTGIGDGHDSRLSAAQNNSLGEMLNADGWSFDLITDKKQFATKLRSGSYSNYAVLSEFVTLDEQIQKELREVVFGGAGLVNAGRHDVRRRIIDNALGIQYSGTQLKPLGIQMHGNSPYMAGQSGTFSQDNDVQRVYLKGAVADGLVRTDVPSAQSSALTHYQYGDGRSIAGTYDMLAEATASNNATNFFARVLLESLNQTSPSFVTPLAGRVLPVRLSISNTGIANTTSVSVSASTGAYITHSKAGTVTAGVVSWSTPLAVGQSSTLDLWVQLPTGNIPVTLTATLNASAGTSVAAPVTVTYLITPVVKPGLEQAIASLAIYVSQQSPVSILSPILDPILGTKTPAGSALELLRKAESDLAAGRVTNALLELTQATDYLIKDSSVSLMPIRLNVDEAIYQTQKLQ